MPTFCSLNISFSYRNYPPCPAATLEGTAGGHTLTMQNPRSTIALASRRPLCPLRPPMQPTTRLHRGRLTHTPITHPACATPAYKPLPPMPCRPRALPPPSLVPGTADWCPLPFCEAAITKPPRNCPRPTLTLLSS